MTTYATTNDYYDAFGIEPSTDEKELRRLGAVLIGASDRVSFAARLGRYATTSAGLPKSSRVADAFKRATLAEARDVEVNGDDASAADYDNISMGGVTLSKSVRTSQADTASEPDLGVRTSSAKIILANAGIFSTAVSRAR